MSSWCSKHSHHTACRDLNKGLKVWAFRYAQWPRVQAPSAVYPRWRGDNSSQRDSWWIPVFFLIKDCSYGSAAFLVWEGKWLTRILEINLSCFPSGPYKKGVVFMSCGQNSWSFKVEEDRRRQRGDIRKLHRCWGCVMVAKVETDES